VRLTSDLIFDILGMQQISQASMAGRQGDQLLVLEEADAWRGIVMGCELDEPHGVAPLAGQWERIGVGVRLFL
jgi:hypothetical protein